MATRTLTTAVTTVAARVMTSSTRARIGRRVVRARAEGEGDGDAGRGTAAATRAPALGLAPKEVLDAIQVPPELVEVRAYVRWEEAGMPSDTTDEWRRREYDEALLDLKVELLRGTTMNEIRARYKMSPVEGGDARMFNEDEDLARRVKAAEALAMNQATTRKVEETTEFIESVVGEEATEETSTVVEAIEETPVEETPVEDDEEADEEIVETVMESSSSSAAENTTEYAVDVFASLTETELADMEAALNESANWSTREELVAAIRSTPEMDADEVDLYKQLEDTKLALLASEQALQETKAELEEIEAEIIVSQATADKALAEMKEGWSAEVSSLEAQLKQANLANAGDVAEAVEALQRDVAEAEKKMKALEDEKSALTKQVEDAKIATIKAEAVRDANAEVVLLLKKELETAKDELRELKSNSVSESEYSSMKNELDRAWEAAAELQAMWDNDRKVIEFLTKSIDDEKAKKEARQALSIPDAAKGLLSWARNTITARATDVSNVSQQTIETVSQAYQELEASTGDFSDDVISDDSESDLLHDM
jgi:hypothetical protein